MHNPIAYGEILAESQSILDELPTTDDPVEKGFICLRSVSHTLNRLYPEGPR